MEINFIFYGEEIEIITNSNFVFDNLRKDFLYFIDMPRSPKISIFVEEKEPPFEIIPPVEASIIKPFAISYDYKNKRYTDYEREALTIKDLMKNSTEIYSLNKERLYEITYVILQTYVGKLLDKKGIHRLHGLGLRIEDRTCVILLPIGGGKTTLAWELLNNYNKIKLISEDTPLINRKLEILPFPIRLGFGKLPSNLNNENLRLFRRKYFSDKYLLDIDLIKDKIYYKISKLDYLLIGTRSFSSDSSICHLSKIKTISTILSNLVLGIGLPQILELMFSKKRRISRTILWIGASRFTTFIKLVLNIPVYNYILGKDTEKNAKILIEFITKMK